MQSDQAEGGGLNFVFESGSSGRENKKYVRSHAAKVGWSQRNRNKAASASASSPNKDKDDDAGIHQSCTPKKRRKTNHQHSDPATASITTNTVQCSTGIAAPVHSGTSSRHVQAPAHRHASSRDIDTVPASSAITSSPWHQPQDIPASARLQEVEASPSSQLPNYLVHQPHSPWQGASHPTHQDSVGPPAAVPQFRPAASPLSMHSRHPVPHASPLPCPRLPPLANPQTTQLSILGANWRQYGKPQHLVQHVSPPSTPVPAESARLQDDSNMPVKSVQQSPLSKNNSAPAFLELVLNEDYPLWKAVDSGNDSFKVFPVKWQPFYGRLLHNYRSNMLVQLDEILTGWSHNDKLEFNSMPLRLASSEPSLFYSMLANAAIMMPPGLVAPVIPKWLQTRTVECLNDAFSDPTRAYSDATILSLNMVALFDTISGSGHIAASTHQPALRKMVDERGGLDKLARKDDIDSMNLVRFLAWTDRVIRSQTGNPLMFEDFKEEESVSKTNWEDIWARMERRVEQNMPQPIEELPDAE